ncbi:hypothetical protein LY76DRAFT_179229 [Colletotrichum caudatum]|nr:hypothetical protein LY76DRAFT_179229 [Colletotrichum caudatum]
MTLRRQPILVSDTTRQDTRRLSTESPPEELVSAFRLFPPGRRKGTRRGGRRVVFPGEVFDEPIFGSMTGGGGGSVWHDARFRADSSSTRTPGKHAGREGNEAKNASTVALFPHVYFVSMVPSLAVDVLGGRHSVARRKPRTCTRGPIKYTVLVDHRFS